LTEVHRVRNEPRPVNTTGTGQAAARRGLLELPQVRHWIISAVLLAAAVLALGLTVQSLPGESAVELGVDQDLSRHHAAVLTVAAMVLNVAFGPVFGLVAIVLIALAVLLVRRSMVDAATFGVLAASGWVASEFFKLLVRRDRPNPGMLFDPLAPETGSDSLPSGHVSFAITLAFALYSLARGTRWARTVAALGVALALVVAWSRVYIGVHYPSDVAASFLAAGAVLILLTGLWNRFAGRMFQLLRINTATPQQLS
jgi:undecaprenyl-diphosphatase